MTWGADSSATISPAGSEVATSASEGAGKWTPELNVWFEDRIVYILPNNDERGRRHAARFAGYLHDVAREIRIVELPGLGDDDVEEWLERIKLPKGSLLPVAQIAPIWRPQDAEPIFDPWETYRSKMDFFSPHPSQPYVLKFQTLV